MGLLCAVCVIQESQHVPRTCAELLDSQTAHSNPIGS